MTDENKNTLMQGKTEEFQASNTQPNMLTKRTAFELRILNPLLILKHPRANNDLDYLDVNREYQKS